MSDLCCGSLIEQLLMTAMADHRTIIVRSNLNYYILFVAVFSASGFAAYKKLIDAIPP